jgi:hypothetical protein
VLTKKSRAPSNRNQAVEQGESLQNSQPLRGLIDRIMIEWKKEATTDKRSTTGVRMVVKSATVIANNGNKTTIGLEGSNEIPCS